MLLATTPENVLYVTGFQSVNQWLIRGSKTLLAGTISAAGETTLISPAGQIDGFVSNPTDVDQVITFDSIIADPGDPAPRIHEDDHLIAAALSDGRPATFWDAVKNVVGTRTRLRWTTQSSSTPWPNCWVAR